MYSNRCQKKKKILIITVLAVLIGLPVGMADNHTMTENQTMNETVPHNQTMQINDSNDTEESDNITNIADTDGNVSNLNETGQASPSINRRTIGGIIGIIALIIILSLVNYRKNHGGMPWTDNLTKARNLHRRAKKMHEKGKEEKAEELYERSNKYREQTLEG